MEAQCVFRLSFILTVLFSQVSSDQYAAPDELARLVSSMDDLLFIVQSSVTESHDELDDLIADVRSFDSGREEQTNCGQFADWHAVLQRSLEDLQRTVSEEMDASNHECSVALSDAIETLGNQRTNVIEGIQELSEQLEELPNTFELLPQPSALVSATTRDCADAQAQGLSSGATTIYSEEDDAPKEVFCDQDTEGGGWMVLVRRMAQDTQLSFDQNYRTYEQGFGDLDGEHWLGLTTLHELTGATPYEMIVTMAKGPETAASYYGSFSIEGRSNRYKLHVSEYDSDRSTAGDPLHYHNGMYFSTIDRDNDRMSIYSCSGVSGRSGWWYNYCFLANPTGLYRSDFSQHDDRRDAWLEWRTWQGKYAHLSALTMMIRPQRD